LRASKSGFFPGFYEMLNQMHFPDAHKDLSEGHIQYYYQSFAACSSCGVKAGMSSIDGWCYTNDALGSDDEDGDAADKVNAQIAEMKARAREVEEQKDRVVQILAAEKEEEDEQKDEEDEEDQEYSTLQEVLESLDDLQTPGSICTGGVASKLPVLPGLTVEGVGVVHVPITETTASALKAVAQQAPYGKGTETIVDRAVRDTWQINADQVSFQNSEWNENLENLVCAAADGLGVAPNMVQAHLYKLLLYETGGFFKKHRDTEKEDGMFATLVVQLPSVFEGGAFVVSHNGKKHTFKLDDAATAPYSSHYVAHYADCEHEILPATSGYRLGLVYSLCYKGKSSETPSARVLETAGRLLRNIERLPREDQLFAVPLDHQYTTISLSALGDGALKGKDKALANTISRAKGWEVFIVQLKRIEYQSGYGWGSNYTVDRIDDTGDPKIEELYFTDGSHARDQEAWVRKQLSFYCLDDGGVILSSAKTADKLMWRLKSASKVEYTGNEGATREATYAVCLLVAFHKNANSFERTCNNRLSDGVKEVLQEPKLLRRLLQLMQRKEPNLFSDDFAKLYPLLRASDLNFWPSFSILINCLFKWDVPCPECATILASLVNDYGWNENTNPIFTFMTSFPSRETALSAFVARTAKALKAMDDVEKDGNMNDMFNKIITDIVALIVKDKGELFWSSGTLVDLLFKRGKSEHFKSISEWLLQAQLEKVSRIRSHFQKSGSSFSNVAKEQFAEFLNGLWKRLQVSELQKRKQNLMKKTHGGKPVFSWRMPAPHVSYPALAEFLRSDQPGPIEIVIKEGMERAKQLASSTMFCHDFKSQPANETRAQEGLSADAVAQGDYKRAVIVVAKTRVYYDALVTRYEVATKALQEVNDELRQLGVNPDTKPAPKPAPNAAAAPKKAPVEMRVKGNDKGKDKKQQPMTLQNVFESLDGIRIPSSTCAGGDASFLPNLPGLTVKGVGVVSLPVMKTTATALKTVAQQASHGKGTRTLQINADKISLGNPDWGKFLEILVKDAVTKLGVDPMLVQAQLCKLLLYEPGGFFKKN
jgi:hypothetical protein